MYFSYDADFNQDIIEMIDYYPDGPNLTLDQEWTK